MKKQIYLILLLQVLFSISALAQLAKTQVVMLSAIANSDGSITLKWPAESYTGTYIIYKRTDQSVLSWGTSPIGTVNGNQNTFTDYSVKKGEAYEYMVLKAKGATEAMGYIYAGNKFLEQRKYGGIILLIDSNMLSPLSAEINTLQTDLLAEGWKVYPIIVGRTEAVPTVKSKIIALNQTALIKPEAIFIIGHVPVPYSGFYSSNGEAPPPDGHIEGSGNHTGAWPADVYYGILSDVFTDANVTCTTGTLPKMQNIPGDGKFDQTKIPANVDLELGRVDLFDMPAFGKSDTVLLRNYLNRNHNWRTGNWKVTERALIDNNFTTYNLASTAYACFPALIGPDSIFDNRDYFQAQRKGDYLWSYGCGAGSFTSCSGVGNTNSFVNDSFQNVFTILNGSFFGDWDIQNNFLRAPLASRSLTSFWGGIPKWYVHHMGMGVRIGTGTRITQNNTEFYFSGNFNSSSHSMHIALMGDPSLKMRNLPALSNLNGSSNNKKVYLNWNKVNEPNIAYAVYILDESKQEFMRLNEQATTDTFYVDDKNFYSKEYVYAVKPIRLETTGSGSYYSTGGAAYTKVNHVNALSPNFGQYANLQVYPNPVTGSQKLNLSFAALQSENLLLEIYTINGQLVQRNNLRANGSGLQSIEITEAPAASGIYLIKLISENGTAYGKFVVE